MRNTTKNIDQKSFRIKKKRFTKIKLSECQCDDLEFKCFKYTDIRQQQKSASETCCMRRKIGHLHKQNNSS